MIIGAVLRNEKLKPVILSLSAYLLDHGNQVKDKYKEYPFQPF